MARRESEPSTLTWIWLWDALQLLLEHYPRPLAEEKLRRAILSKDVRSKDVQANRHDRGWLDENLWSVAFIVCLRRRSQAERRLRPLCNNRVLDCLIGVCASARAELGGRGHIPQASLGPGNLKRKQKN